MSAVFVAVLLLAHEGAVRRAVETFNARAVPEFPACWAPGQSQMYFEVTAVRFTPDGAEARANGNRYGSVFLKRTSPAVFHLKQEGGDWKIDALRVADGCLEAMR